MNLSYAYLSRQQLLLGKLNCTLQPLQHSQPNTFLTCDPQGVYTQGVHCIDAVMSLAAGYQSLLLTYAVTACDACALGSPV